MTRTRHLLFRAVFCLVLLAAPTAALLLPACSDEEAVEVDLSRREEIDLAGPTADLTYAYLPQYSHTVSYRRHNPLVEYLGRATGLSVRQIYPDTFDEHMNMVGRAEIDISFVNPFVYVKLARRYGARAFARVVENGRADYFRGQVIARADDPDIREIADLRGKTWIAVDSSSAGGYLLPLGLFARHGLGPSDFAGVDFAPGPGGKQEKVVLSVFAGKHDFGTIREGTLEVLAGKIDLDQIRVLARTETYPGWVWAARQGLDPARLAAVKRAMLALGTAAEARPGDPADPVAVRVLSRAEIENIIPSRDTDFDRLRRLLDSLLPEAAGGAP
jgi:phosphonate transport system substrate-binding protein